MMSPQSPNAVTGSTNSRRILRWTFALLLLAVLGIIFGSGPGRLPLSRDTAITFILVGVLLFNALWWELADRCLARSIRSARAKRWCRIALLTYVLVVCGPVFQGLFLGRWDDTRPPMTWVIWVELWHMGLIVLLSLGWPFRWAWALAATLTSFIRSRSPEAPINQSPEGRRRIADAPPNPTLSRRAWLQQTVAAAPVVLVGGGTLIGRLQHNRLQIHRHNVFLPQLPRSLAGLTITHVSDFHIGRLVRPAELPRLVDTVNSLRSDIIVVTGDFVDRSNRVLPDTVAALKQFEAPYGRYFAIGNHDLIDDGQAFIDYMLRENQPLMLNEQRPLIISGERITIGSLNWGNHPRGAEQTFGPGPVQGCVIALAHHPHAFDSLAPRGVALTLSGHTHGGQLMLSPPGDPADIGVGRLLFHYIRGFYRNGNSQLFVNSGVGNWFPVRINAPAEVVQLRLT